MLECYKKFCEFYPHLITELYSSYEQWLLSEDEKVVAFKQGWLASRQWVLAEKLLVRLSST